MKMSEYQELVADTMNLGLTRDQAITNYAMGLAGEAGEVIEPLKKFVFAGRSLDITNIAEEIGDVAWYLAALANTLGIDLDEALANNITKLKARYPKGFKAAGGRDGG